MSRLDDIQRAAGQMLVAGFDGHELPAEVSSALRSGRLGGVILFRRNLTTLEQVVELNRSIAKTCGNGLPPWISVDQEGGRVERLTEAMGATSFPPMRVVGERGDPELAKRVGETIGAELSALGFNVDFAPVLDVDTNPANPVIGDRSFSRAPEEVARLGLALGAGLLDAGVVPCGKHFPGHGDTEVDSHLGLPLLKHGFERLDSVELVPFRAAIQANIPLMMTAHIVFSSLDEENPATLSTKVLQGLLRDRLGYRGVIVSDDLEMGAIADNYSIPEAVSLGLHAGIDLFLICHRASAWTAAFETLVREAERSTPARTRLLSAGARIRRAKKSLLPAKPFVPSPSWRDRVGTDAHRQVAALLSHTAE